MARYIDADKFIAELEQEKTVALEFEDGVAVYEIEHTMNLIGMQPTADVVPKSEVEKWKEINEQLHKEMSERMIEERKIERKLVAREIFAEIEAEITAALKSNYEARSVYNPTDEFGMWVQGKIDALRGIEYFVAELKKKYTEGER